MIVIEIFQFLLIFITGIIACYTDIKKGIIQNKLILISGIIGISFDVIYYIVFAKSLFNELLKNAIFLIIISVLMYAFHIWAGGDCKFLILLSLIYPARYYWYYNNSRFTFWVFMALTFSVGFVYIIFDSVCNFIKNRNSQRAFFIKLKYVMINYVKNIIYLTALRHICSIFLGDKIQISNAVYFVICVAFVFGINQIKIFKSWIVVAVVFLFDIVMSIITKYIPVSVDWLNYVLLFGIMVARVFAESYNYEKIKTDNIKAGMVISQKDSMLFSQSRVKGLPGISDETLKSRITQEEADSIKRWKNSKFGLSELTVVRKIPFAVFIVIGLVLYLIIGGILGCY